MTGVRVVTAAEAVDVVVATNDAHATIVAASVAMRREARQVIAISPSEVSRAA
jgi:hypothetical protein